MILLKAQFINPLPSADDGRFKHSVRSMPPMTIPSAI